MARLVSRPTRSRRAKGPMGKPQAPCMAVSMSSLEATPSSSRRMALLRYGKRRALTTKPARSATSTARLPQDSTKARAVDMVPSLTVRGRTSSTRSMTVAGLKKWIPHTCSGRPVSMAISITGRVEVFEARMVGSGQRRSRSLNRCFFTARSSTTDSITRSQRARASSSEVAVTRPRAASRSSAESLPLSTRRLRDLSRAAMVASAVACWWDRSTTSWPARAAHSAMPYPTPPRATMEGGYRSVGSSVLLGYGHRLDGDPLLGIAAPGACGVEGRHHVQALNDLAEQGVLGGEAHAVGATDDEELAPVGVGPGIGHGQRPHLVAPRGRQLVGEAVTGAAPARAFGVTPLDHEAGDDPVEDDAVEVVVAGQEHEVVDRPGGGQGVEGDGHGALGGDHLRLVAPLRVYAHGGRAVEAPALGAGAVGGRAVCGHGGFLQGSRVRARWSRTTCGG